MSAHVVHHEHPSRPAEAILAFGVLAVVSAVLTALLSFTDLLGPPEWVRVVMTAGIPIGLIGAPSVWWLFREARQEVAAKVGMGLVALTLVAFIVMVNVGY